VIRRDRKKYAAPASLALSSASIVAELANNQKIVDDNDAAGHPWGKWSAELVFSMYAKDNDVKEKLSALFSNKCAYCEGSLNVTYMNTEHYRPKGGVEACDDPGKRGYWWLAACWHNLLPACTLCNSSPGTDHPTGIRYGSGKGNRFPLLPGSARACKPGDEQHEKPALLDPSVDEPSDYFTFKCIPNTKLWEAVKLPRLSPKSATRASQTIDIFGLNHTALVRERTQHLKGVAIAAKAYAQEAIAYNHAVRTGAAPPALADAQCKADEAWKELYEAFLTPECRYLHSAVRCVEEVLATHGLRLKNLLGKKRLHLPTRNLV
jgi:uncharacterized protein (TIGR02646 family)